MLASSSSGNTKHNTYKSGNKTYVPDIGYDHNGTQMASKPAAR